MIENNLYLTLTFEGHSDGDEFGVRPLVVYQVGQALAGVLEALLTGEEQREWAVEVLLVGADLGSLKLKFLPKLIRKGAEPFGADKIDLTTKRYDIAARAVKDLVKLASWGVAAALLAPLSSGKADDANGNLAVMETQYDALLRAAIASDASKVTMRLPDGTVLEIVGPSSSRTALIGAKSQGSSRLTGRFGGHLTIRGGPIELTNVHSGEVKQFYIGAIDFEGNETYLIDWQSKRPIEDAIKQRGDGVNVSGEHSLFDSSQWRSDVPIAPELMYVRGVIRVEKQTVSE
ncbi:hypothetical protein [Sphingobium yanoikuyae]|uniref:hypothetical protein n=1 Tax=Sphingobium yanoikuyae TaxID=13690 RepID=UPI0026EAE3B2|nr:hypothetical protein [Sphingobium yanoikuyae]